jgi:hypothetical protein
MIVALVAKELTVLPSLDPSLIKNSPRDKKPYQDLMEAYFAVDA